jgi:hypothetical protein
MWWQLKNLVTGESLNEPQENLPENWGPIFGLVGIQDRLGDLSWLGENFAGQGWVQVEPPSPPPPRELTTQEKIDAAMQAINQLLSESADYVSFDNASLTKGQIADWIEYRRVLRELQLRPNFPEEINWPIKPKT